MADATTYPVAYVFVCFSDQQGAESTIRYVVPHDGARQASEEAINAIFRHDDIPGSLPPGYRIREVLVFENVEPRRFFHEKIIRPGFVLRETP
jgi:hypothetical protein